MMQEFIKSIISPAGILPQNRRFGTVVSLVALGCAVVFTSCGKKSESTPPKPAVESTPDAVPARPVVQRPAGGAPTAQSAQPAAPIPANASAEAAAEQMTMELRRYVAYTRTIPKSFEDFVARHPMKFPAAPAGKKYVIEEGRVVIR